ncbi:MAG: PEP/pyruvate-binding domain-containing protein [Kiritimatiellia bacterium]|jgi:hypothetical protein|nr:PEP/pyruvate-binding domain-containing protein [Kiritimatiellia bacterium]
MTTSPQSGDTPLDSVLEALRERAKELDCLYRVEELLGQHDRPLSELLQDVVQQLPSGWQFPEVCQARITTEMATYDSAAYLPPTCGHTADIVMDGAVIGSVAVSYIQKVPLRAKDCFLEKEHTLIRTVADRISQTIQHRKLRQLRDQWEAAHRELDNPSMREWMVIVDLIRRTDPLMLNYISRQMLHRLTRIGVEEARDLVRSSNRIGEEDLLEESNSPIHAQDMDQILAVSDAVFKLASQHLSADDILASTQKWIQDKRASFLIKSVDNATTTLEDIIEAVSLYKTMTDKAVRLSPSAEKWLKVSLIQRFFSDDLEYIKTAKENVEVTDFHGLVQHIIFPAGSGGNLGGKSAGLFLAQSILARGDEPELKNLRFPKTWYLPVDALTVFLHVNELESINEQKYKDLDQVRLEYPDIVHLLKCSWFPSDIEKGVAAALDDFGDVPLIVRSSSQLEDRVGASFAGKYKSLFLANRGSKAERLKAVLEAIAEVYASLFGPDPIEYRAVCGLQDFNEKMAIMIQEVVGQQVGEYFFPVYSGVAFSNNEFRWSPRIKREDGLVRLVPGLGTRAVDRVNDDYSVLVSPGAPNLRVNVTPDEVCRYSPKKMDVINLETGRFETIGIDEFLKNHGMETPVINRIVSACSEGGLLAPAGIHTDFAHDQAVVTFEGLIQKTPFIKGVQTILKRLQEKTGRPVDIEFASDGTYFYLLQCRSQSLTDVNASSPIPADVPEERILFTADRFVSNAPIPEITHIVYVDPKGYAGLATRSELLDVARAVGMLNRILPKRKFILMGPGRWGSRGDIKLGVPITYSDINNTAVLIEIARRKGNHVPELSFGTHFFQDLVESFIHYLPLYPDDEGIRFNRDFLQRSPNLLPELLPAFASLADVIRVIDVPQSADGRILKILLNADEEAALGFLADPSGKDEKSARPLDRPLEDSLSKDHWRWRLRMAEQIALRLSPTRFGIKALYVFGSTSNESARPNSDINLLVHFTGTDQQRADLTSWLEGWSQSLAEVNYLRTGYPADGLLDVHWLTDDDVAHNRGFAAKITAVTNPARPLPLKLVDG